jgi:hypothetical protein
MNNLQFRLCRQSRCRSLVTFSTVLSNSARIMLRSYSWRFKRDSVDWILVAWLW